MDSKQQRLATLEKLRVRWGEVVLQQPGSLPTGFAALTAPWVLGACHAGM
jgi:hypothetical protein